MSPPDPKTKIRPQQSCLKCRERKVKCDRSIPCHACILRGLEAECTYLSSPEDRAHISQAEMIERLRREVAQLRGQLAQTPRGPAPRRKHDLQFQAHAFVAGAPVVASASNAYIPSPGFVPGPGPGTEAVGAGAAAAAEVDGSWAASSPESASTNMTYAMTVTSPESTGSESGPGAPSVHPYSASPYNTQIADLELATAAVDSAGFGNQTSLDTTLVSHCQPGMVPFAGDMPMMHFPTDLQQRYGRESPRYTLDEGGNAQTFIASNNYNSYKPAFTNGIDEQSHTYHNQWGQHASGPQANDLPPWQDALSYRFINAFNNAHSNANYQVPELHHAPHAPLAQGAADSPSHGYSQSPLHSFPSSWRGQGKQELLETLLETIGSCDEGRVAHVVQVVRASATPEEAVSGICQVLGIGR